MHWVYILKCSNDYYYVGETTRLYRRFWEHESSNGGVNTSIFTPEEIVAIYKVSSLGKFFEYDDMVRNKICNIYFDRSKPILDNFNDGDDQYDHLLVENNIAECLIINDKDNWKRIRGGKYTRIDVEYTFPNNDSVANLPLCNCALPCDINYNNEHGNLYFRCAKKNMWSKMKEEFGLECQPCSFYMKYTKDIEYKKYCESHKQTIYRLVSRSMWLEQLVGGQYQFCVGGCGKEYDPDNTVRYSRKAINLCFDCFVNKNGELSKKYSKCLIQLDDI